MSGDLTTNNAETQPENTQQQPAQGQTQDAQNATPAPVAATTTEAMDEDHDEEGEEDEEGLGGPGLVQIGDDTFVIQAGSEEEMMRQLEQMGIDTDGMEDMMDDDEMEEGEEGEEGEVDAAPRIFEPERSDAESVFSAHTGPVHCLAQNADGSKVASGGEDDIVLVWSWPSGEVEHKLEGHNETITSVVWAGSKLVSGGLEGVVRVWETGKQIHEWAALADGVEWLVAHPKGPVVAGGASNGSVAMWNADKGACMQFFAGHTAAVNCGCWTADANALVTGSDDGTVKVWDPKTGAHLHSFESLTHSLPEAGVTAVHAHSRHPEVIFVGYSNGNVAMLGTKSGKKLNIFKDHVGTDEENPISVESLACCPTVPLLASGDSDGVLCVFDLSGAGRLRYKVRVGECIVKLGWVGETLIICTSDGAVVVRDGRVQEDPKERRLLGHCSTVLDFIVDEKRKKIISSSDDNTVRTFPLVAPESA